MIDFFSYVAAKLRDDLFYVKDDQNQTPVRLVNLDSFDNKCIKVVNDLRESVDSFR